MGRMNTNLEELVLNNRVITKRPCVWPFLPLYHIMVAQGSSLEVEHVRPSDLELSTPKTVNKSSLFLYKITSIMYLSVQHKWTKTVVKSY